MTAANASLADAVAAQKQAQLDFDRSSKLLAGNSVSKRKKAPSRVACFAISGLLSHAIIGGGGRPRLLAIDSS